MIKKTLGGDRLGAGKKMQVELHGYERSTHDLGYVWRSTMAAGTLVPFMSEVALPGDTFDIKLNCDVKTHPTIGPLFGSFKVQLDVFLAPIRLYNSLLHNNTLGIGMNISQVKFPQIKLTTEATAVKEQDYDNSQINPSCILAYLGIRGIGNDQGVGGKTREFNAIPWLAYWEIYKNYYANKQEEIGAVIHRPVATVNKSAIDIVLALQFTTDSIANGETIPMSTQTQKDVPATGGNYLVINYGPSNNPPSLEDIILETSAGAKPVSEFSNGYIDQKIDPPDIGRLVISFGTETTIHNWRYREGADGGLAPQVETFPLEHIDQMRERILSYHSKTAPYLLENVPNNTPTPYYWVFNKPTSTQEGLAIKTYQSDMFNNWLSTEWIDGANGISQITAVSTAGDEFTIDSLNLAKKVYDMLNRIAVSGGSYDDWMDAVYAHDRYTRAESPMYMGGLSKELVFEELVSTSAADGQVQGTLAGKGRLTGKHKGGDITIKVDEPGYIIGIISLTPRIDYSQGNKWDIHLKTMDDLHKPALDEIGFQELITEQMVWWGTAASGNDWIQLSAGKQPAWLNYMTNVNRTFGNFAIRDNEMFMTLNRRYEQDGNTSNPLDLTTYIDPVKFNNIFAETARDAQNFWTQIGVDITARRKMSAKLMPNL